MPLFQAFMTRAYVTLVEAADPEEAVEKAANADITEWTGVDYDYEVREV